jgi:hypothetical protein
MVVRGAMLTPVHSIHGCVIPIHMVSLQNPAWLCSSVENVYICCSAARGEGIRGCQEEGSSRRVPVP